MRENIIKIYQNLQESDLIQKERALSDKIVMQIAEQIKQDENIKLEEIHEELYKLTSIAEESGFVAGFRYAVRLMKEC